MQTDEVFFLNTFCSNKNNKKFRKIHFFRYLFISQQFKNSNKDTFYVFDRHEGTKKLTLAELRKLCHNCVIIIKIKHAQTLNLRIFISCFHQL